MSARIENEKETILEAVRMAFDEFDDYEESGAKRRKTNPISACPSALKFLTGNKRSA